MSLETVLYCDLIIYCYSLIRNYERYHIYIVGFRLQQTWGHFKRKYNERVSCAR